MADDADNADQRIGEVVTTPSAERIVAYWIFHQENQACATSAGMSSADWSKASADSAAISTRYNQWLSPPQ